MNWSNGRKVVDLEYADDAVLLCKTLEDLQHMLTRMHEISKEVGLKINKIKTAVVRSEYALRDELTL